MNMLRFVKVFLSTQRQIRIEKRGKFNEVNVVIINLPSKKNTANTLTSFLRFAVYSIYCKGEAANSVCLGCYIL